MWRGHSTEKITTFAFAWKQRKANGSNGPGFDGVLNWRLIRENLGGVPKRKCIPYQVEKQKLVLLPKMSLHMAAYYNGKYDGWLTPFLFPTMDTCLLWITITDDFCPSLKTEMVPPNDRMGFGISTLKYMHTMIVNLAGNAAVCWQLSSVGIGDDVNMSR